LLSAANKINTLEIPRSIFNSTIQNLQENGLEGNEGIAFWTGTLHDTTAQIKNVIFANSYPEFENQELFARVPLLTSFKIGELVHQRNEKLFVQIHSHPFEAFHSFVDNKYPISHKIGFLSVVVPYFGKNVTDLSPCKVYEYLGNGKWKELSQKEISERLVIGEGA